ncbi:MAG: hypothetical protein P4L82_07340, partial [Ancalomicrobiaceae bacterium]|nr:hypothetical protein [Ancalomicrobiaceae bacterium]
CGAMAAGRLSFGRRRGCVRRAPVVPYKFAADRRQVVAPSQSCPFRIRWDDDLSGATGSALQVIRHL